jgi:tetratricopeptide (TPR) repeat protein
MSPNDAEAFNNKAIVYYDLKMYNEAIQSFDMSFEFNPNYV